MIKLSPSTYQLLGGAALASGVSVAQSLYWDSVDRLWYVCQPDGTTGGDMDRVTVSRLTENGQLIDKMHVGRAGHGANLGVERTGGKIFLWTDALASGGWATAIARIPYVPNGTADSGDPLYVRRPRTGVHRVSATIDPTRNQLIYRWQSEDIKSESAVGGFDRYDLTAAAAGTFTPLATLPFGASGKTLQGFTSLGDHVYHLYGDKNVNNMVLTCTDWATGTVLQSQAVNPLSWLPYREPEGLCVYKDEVAGDILAFGVAGRVDEVRQLNVLRFPLPGTPPWIDVDFDEAKFAPPHSSYAPQYRLHRDQVSLHFSLSKRDETAWAPGETLFQLPPAARPFRTQRLVGVVSGSAVSGDGMTVRFEIGSDGDVRIWDERPLVGWVGGDFSYWTC